MVKVYSDTIINDSLLNLSETRKPAFLYDDIKSVPRRADRIFFVIDCLDTMYGSKIDTLNTAIEELDP